MISTKLHIKIVLFERKVLKFSLLLSTIARFLLYLSLNRAVLLKGNNMRYK